MTTLQKFPEISSEIAEYPGNHFAVLVDEAHSCQGDEVACHLHSVLSTGNLEQAEKLDGEEPITLEGHIYEEIKKRGCFPNISYFASTIILKSHTLEMLDTPHPDNKCEAFSLYSMHQATKEGFIIEVLENYTAYHTY